MCIRHLRQPPETAGGNKRHKSQMQQKIHCAPLHKCNIKNQLASSYLSVHVQEYKDCYICWDDYAFLDFGPDQYKRLMKETLRIGVAGNCISTASLQFDTRSKSFFAI